MANFKNIYELHVNSTIFTGVREQIDGEHTDKPKP